MTGLTITHYQVLELLGSGGMGEVYKARDTRLNRLVAIKVLRRDLVSNANRKQRFIQEAQAASALNHPNIVTVHDVFQHEGVDCLVMEYIAGKTLDALIPRQGMRLSEALRIAVQVAEGLRKAHSAGIVHRDIKPSNVMVPDDGPVKILDFGLAKLTESGGTSEDERTRTVRPETEEGTILGTVAYMSPEQAEGRKLDVRTDIFSFGALLYEMLTGRRAFVGDSKLATMSAILKDEPKPLENVPSDLEKIIRRCLRKDPAKRFHHMDDVKVTLDEVREDSESGRLSTAVLPAAAPTRRWPWIAAMAGTAAIVVAGFVLWRGGDKPRASQGTVLRQVTFDPGLTTEPSVWTAGNMIAYASDRAGDNLDIWVQHLETGESRRLTTNPADDREPAFSPDGSRIAFRSERDGGGIYVMSSLGGEERRIADGGRGPSFSPDGKWIAYYEGLFSLDFPYANSGPALYIVPAAGGAPRRLASAFIGVSQAVWSPDGNYVIFFGGPTFQTADWWVAPVDGGAPVQTGAVAIFGEQKFQPRAPNAWNGDAIYFPADLGDSRNIWRVRIDPKTFKATGQAERLTSGNGLEEYATVSGQRLVFANLTENADIWSLPIEPNSAKVTGEVQRITEELAQNDNVSVDRAGKQAVYRTYRGGTANVVWKHLTTGQERVLATSRAIQPAPRISPDGSRVAFVDLVSEKLVIHLIPASGGPARLIAEGMFSRNWASDGRRLVVSIGAQSSTGFLDVETGKTNLFLPYPPGGGHSAPGTSPDDRWMVFYTHIDNGRSKVWVAPVRESKVPMEEWIQITDGRYWDAVPEFSPDGKTIYFLSHRDGFRCHWAIHVDAATKKPAGNPFAVQHYHNPRRSPGYVRRGRVANAVARDKIVFTMAERTGNIWMAELGR